MKLPEILHIDAVGYNGRGGFNAHMLARTGNRLRAVPPAFMPYEAFCRVLGEMPGLKRLHIGGAGDPMLHPRFFDMVRHAVRQGIEVSAYSLLTGLSEARADLCVESGLARLMIPFDDSDPVLQRNLMRLAHAKARAGTAKPEVELVDDTPKTDGHCDRPWRAIYLGTRCEAMPCDRARGPLGPSFGNMAKEGVIKVWNAEPFRDFRERLASGTPPDVCAACRHRHSPLDLGENAAWNASTTPSRSAPLSMTEQTPTAA